MEIRDYLDELNKVEKSEDFDVLEWSRKVLPIDGNNEYALSVKVTSIADEYKILNHIFPDYEHKIQSLKFDGEDGVRKAYDQHVIKYEGKEFAILFDINLFFGK
jgi:hypothetical protein